MTSKATRVRITDAGDSIRRREAFIAGDGSLAGSLFRPNASEMGKLPDTSRDALSAAHDTHGAALYVVRSYGTPIGWAGPGEALTVPAVTYSPTTSRHQGITRRADSSAECTICGAPESIWGDDRPGAGHRHAI